MDLFLVENFARKFLTSPILTVVVMCLALGTSQLLLQIFTPIQSITQRISQSQRYNTIDGLRGYLALGVFASHIPITWTYLTKGRWTFPPNSNFYALLGETCVTLFFMITGFLFWKRLLVLQGYLDWRVFLIGRIFRIYPLYLFMLVVISLICIALQGWIVHDSFAVVIKNYAKWLVFATPNINQQPDTAMFIAYVTWSLRYEWLFYLILPFAALLYRISKQDWLGLAFGIMCVIVILVLDSQRHFVGQNCMSFLGGIIAAYIVNSVKTTRVLRSNSAGILGIIGVFYVLFFLPTSHTLLAFCALTYFFIVVASGNSLGNILQLPSVLWLGEISYGIYLLHGLLLWFGGQYCFQYVTINVSATIFLEILIFVNISIILVVSLTYFFVEKIGIELGQNLVKVVIRKK